MSNQQQALESLVEWFGHDGFVVRDMTDTQVSKLIRLAGIRAVSPTNKIARNSSLGTWLSTCPKGNGLEVDVVRPAKNEVAATYRVQSAMNVEYLESFEVLLCPNPTDGLANSLFGPYRLRLKFVDNPSIQEIVVSRRLIEELLLRLVGLGLGRDNQTYD